MKKKTGISKKAGAASLVWRERAIAELQSVKSVPRSRLLRALARFLERSDADVVVTTRQQLDVVSRLIKEEARRSPDVERDLTLLDDRIYVLARRLNKANMKLATVLRAKVANESGKGPAEPDWDESRFSLLSQNEEDGYILALLQHCGPLMHTFVELGSGRSGGNSGMLALEARWRGLMVEASSADAKVAKRRFGASGRVAVLNAFVTRANVDEIISDHGLGPEIDLLSLDIDSFEYWVLAGLERCRPKLLVVEYNDYFGAERRVTVPEHLDQPLNAKLGYHGASLGALDALAKKKDFRLIGCDASGTNAFFLRNDIAPEIPGRAPADVFRSQARHADAEIGEPHFRKLAQFALPLIEV